MKRRSLPSMLFLAATSAMNGVSLACSTCGVDPDSQVGSAANGTLWLLLGLVAFMFLATGFTAFYIWRRASLPVPPHIQLVENLTSQPEER